MQLWSSLIGMTPNALMNKYVPQNIPLEKAVVIEALNSKEKQQIAMFEHNWLEVKKELINYASKKCTRAW